MSMVMIIGGVALFLIIAVASAIVAWREQDENRQETASKRDGENADTRS